MKKMLMGVLLVASLGLNSVHGMKADQQGCDGAEGNQEGDKAVRVEPGRGVVLRKSGAGFTAWCANVMQTRKMEAACKVLGVPAVAYILVMVWDGVVGFNCDPASANAIATSVICPVAGWSWAALAKLGLGVSGLVASAREYMCGQQGVGTGVQPQAGQGVEPVPVRDDYQGQQVEAFNGDFEVDVNGVQHPAGGDVQGGARSEERRVGKECRL